MRRFGSNRISGLMDKLGMDDDTPIEHNLISKTIENAQTKVEGHNFDLRKHLVEYDDVMNKHREVIYARRRKLLSGENLREHMLDLIEGQVELIVTVNMPEDKHLEPDYEAMLESFKGLVARDPGLTVRDIQDRPAEEIVEILLSKAEQIYEAREKEMGAEQMRTVERLVLLEKIDRLWIEHLTAMDHMRQGIGLQAFGQRDPLVAYKTEGYNMFQQLLTNIDYDVAHAIFRAQLVSAFYQPAVQPGMTNHPSEARQPIRRESQKIGRNAPCPCGSGKKYKQCCGAPAAVKRAAAVRG